MNSIERGERAKELLDNPLVEEALIRIKEFLVEEWATNTDSQAREELWFTLKGLERFKNYFEAAVSSGQYDLAQYSNEKRS